MLFRHFDAEIVAERFDVPKVVFVKLIAGVKFNYSIWRNASHGAAAYRSRADKVLSAIRAAEDIPAIGVELKGMDVDLTALAVAKHEIAVARIIARYVGIAALFEQLAQLGNIGMPDRNIEIAVTPGLPAKQCVNAPASVHPDADSVRDEQAI